MDPDDTTGDGRPPKRRKVRLACQECRDKKTRCDGGRPVCESCQRKRIQCTYLDASTTAEHDSEYIKSLEGRVRELERSASQRPDHVDFVSALAPALAPALAGLPRASPTTIAGPPAASSITVASVPPGNTLNDSHIAAGHLMDLQNHHRTYSGIEHRNSDASHSLGDLQLQTPVPGQMEAPPNQYRSPGRSQHLDRIPTQPSPVSLPTYTSHNGQHPRPQVRDRARSVDNNEDDSDDNTPGDATMGASEGTPGKSGRVFLGPSSVAAFMKTVQETTGIGIGTGSLSQLGREDGANSTVSRASQKRTMESRNQLHTLLADLTLPPRRLADKQLASYWHHSHLFYPVLHRPSFMQKYEDVWSGSEDELRLFDGSVHQLRAFYATLNIALAIGCSFLGPDTASSLTTSKTMFDRSQTLLRDADVDHGSVQLVQAYILTAQYLQSTDMANRCWVTVGTAIRVAQGIGIQVNRRSESQAEREERKRTWWCCLLMDRVLSMTFGRPPMVVWPTEVPIPEPVDDDLLSQEVGSSSQPLPQQEESTNAFFTHTVKLTDHLMSVLRYLYRPIHERKQNKMGQNPRPFSDLSLITEVDGDLARWRQGLPPYLRYQRDEASTAAVTPDSPTYLRQSSVLHARYLHLRTLLFRPLIMELSNNSTIFGDPSSTSTDFQQIALSGCIRSCVWAAEELVDLIHSRINTNRTPPWWYSIFYMYSCGSVMLSVLLSPNLQRAYGESIEKIAGAWSRCMETLAHFDTQGSKFARQCRRILQAAITPQMWSRDPAAQDSFIPNLDSQIGGQGDIHLQQALPNSEEPGTMVDLDGMTFTDMLWPAGSQDWLNSLPDDRDDLAHVARFGTMPM